MIILPGCVIATGFCRYKQTHNIYYMIRFNFSNIGGFGAKPLPPFNLQLYTSLKKRFHKFVYTQKNLTLHETIVILQKFESLQLQKHKNLNNIYNHPICIIYSCLDDINKLSNSSGRIIY